MFTLSRHWMRFGVVLVLALILAVGFSGTASAAEFRSGDAITIGANEVIDDDLYLAGGTVTMNGTINGDLFVAGDQIEVNGTVNGSLFIAGQTLTINGKVTGSVYGGGSAVTFGPQASIGRNVYLAGFSLKGASGSSVGRDVFAAGYQALLGGEVKRDVYFGGGALELNGKVGRNVNAEVGEPQAGGQAGFMYFGPNMPPAVGLGLRVSKDASIGGKLTYRSTAEQAGAIQAAPAGGVAFQQEVKPEAEVPRASAVMLFAGWALDVVREFVTLLLLGLLAVWILPQLLGKAASALQGKPLPSVGWGLLAVIVGAVGAVILVVLIFTVGIIFGAITLGGLAGTIFGVGLSAWGLALAVFSFLVSYGSKIVVAYLIGKLILGQLARAYTGRAWAMVVGVVVYVLVASIPILGWLIGLLATLFGVGAMWLVFQNWRATAKPALIPAAA